MKALKWTKHPAWVDGAGQVQGPVLKSPMGDVTWDAQRLGWMALSFWVQPYQWGPFATAREAQDVIEGLPT